MEKEIRLRTEPLSLFLLAAAALAFSYGISCFWAVDRGMAVFGFCKFLPLPLFSLAVMQTEENERERLLDTLPISGGIMTVLSFGLRQLFPVLWDRFYVGDRLAGFFQYPNTFALFLLAGILVLAGKEKWNLPRGLNLAVLAAGIALSGSRTVFFLLGAAAIVLCFISKGKMRWILCLGLAAFVGATALYAALTGKIPAMGRYLTSSIQSSTFLGRLLYFKDAFPVTAKNPFGLGYMGYFYILFFALMTEEKWFLSRRNTLSLSKHAAVLGNFRRCRLELPKDRRVLNGSGLEKTTFLPDYCKMRKLK